MNRIKWAIILQALAAGVVLAWLAVMHAEPTTDELYGCTVAQQTTDGECK